MPPNLTAADVDAHKCATCGDWQCKAPSHHNRYQAEGYCPRNKMMLRGFEGCEGHSGLRERKQLALLEEGKC